MIIYSLSDNSIIYNPYFPFESEYLNTISSHDGTQTFIHILIHNITDDKFVVKTYHKETNEMETILVLDDEKGLQGRAQKLIKVDQDLLYYDETNLVDLSTKLILVTFPNTILNIEHQNEFLIIYSDKVYIYNTITSQIESWRQ